MNSGPEWTQAAQQFQQSFGESWKQALQSFQQLGVPGLGSMPGAAAPKTLGFSSEKLQTLQQNYIKEATALWHEGLQAHPGQQDRRFAGTAWDSNPVAAFSAAAAMQMGFFKCT